MEAIKFTSFELNLTDEVINRLEQLGYTPESLKEAIKNHEQTNGSDSPAIYCGTYGKYNDGSLFGLWIDLSSFDDYDEFINFCKAIHADEDDPELMFQDYENMSRLLYHESMGEAEFDKIAKYCELCDDYSEEAVEDFLEWDSTDDLDRMHDAYVGVYESEEDFAEEIVSDCYDLDNMMGGLACYFDYEKFSRDLFMSDYYFGSHGTVFRTF